MDFSAFNLPACEIVQRVNTALCSNSSLVITAPPGAGKSTLLPLTILQGLGPQGKILVLEPRRIAARQIAERMSSMLGEPVGSTVGYRVRFESKVSAQTRIEVLTEGILTRMIADDPTLEDVSIVIFDEFHERNLNSDVALALVRATLQIIRPDLKIVLMSATIDAGAIAAQLSAPLIASPGRCYPVEIRHTEDIPSVQDIPEYVAKYIRIAHSQTQGDILAFLPGEAEIRRCQEMLSAGMGDTLVCPLYGMLPFERQKEAIRPSADGKRRIVLATPVAETSLTIEGVRTVVDSGFCKTMVYDQRSGLSRLECVRISLDMADQRSGRAGRLAPGVCYRLWSQATQSRMDEFRKPEILEADLAPVLLDIASWGGARIDELDWLTSPPAYSLKKATELLEAMGAIENGRITAHGGKLAKMPCHPRIAQMFLLSASNQMKALACDIAAILDDRDPLASDPLAGADLCARINALRQARNRSSAGAGKWGRIASIAQQYKRLARCESDDSATDIYKVGALVAHAYPLRVAKAVQGRLGVYQLASGEMARLDNTDALCSYDYLAIADVNARLQGEGRIFLAAAVDVNDVMDLARERLNLSWDSRNGAIVARRETRIGTLLVSAKEVHDLPVGKRVEIIAAAAPKEGLGIFDFNDEVAMLQRRLENVRSWHPEFELPDTDTPSVLENCASWLPLYIGNAKTSAELKKIDMQQVIWNMLSYEQQNFVERVAPSHIQVPTGSRIRLDYRQGADAPVLRVRLQECFGLIDTPRVDNGRLPVLMELLSPGFKPVQLTSDLKSFWQGTYFEVRKELKRRYPKHSWPDNPLEAEAVRGVARKA